MNKHVGSFTLAVLLALSPTVPAFSFAPQQSSEQKGDCDKSSDGKSNSKNCEKTQTAKNNSQSSKPAAGKKDGDKLSDDHMSTRGLKPPPKDDKDKQAKPENPPKP
jgi:hypothetical protein